ncbi:MAG: S9 family peptidase [Candidatus Fermentithermobacillus carboniphilus]|uniref:S9 family peptidase n=1 Tax=Candidatus Fermentithermobacillus carboniphilus TaxID=3085328 RepID=A0AAT9LAF0_9FIRM|nr:MAG: S9 family peptidase [Candidatus Fermentithermobacillus carboniphilus]
MRRITSEDLYSMKWASDPEVSPDGKKVLFTVKTVTDEGKLKGYKTNIWLASDGKVRQFTFGPGNDWNPRWSPCGRKVAFLSDRGKDKTQIYLLSLDGGEAVQMTSGLSGIGDIVFSPCGEKIAFTALEGGAESGDSSSDQDKSDVRVITRIRYKLNGKGFLPEKRTQIYVLDIGSGKVTQLTEGPYDCREPAWSPDGRFIAFTSARFEDHDLSPVRDVWVIPAEGGEMRKISSGDAVLSAPSWSPDGKYIACYGHDNKYWGATVTGIYLLSVDGGPVRYLTKERELGVTETPASDMVSSPVPRPAWSKDGRTIYFSALVKGKSHLYQVDTVTGDVGAITSGNCSVYGWSRALREDVFAVALTSFDLISDVFIVDLRSCAGPEEKLNGSPVCESRLEKSPLEILVGCEGGKFSSGAAKRLTRLNDDLLSSVYLSVPEEIEVKSPDGTPIQAWVMKPVGIKDGVKYPLILEIHGGPHSAYGVAFFHEFQFLASRGYGVVFGNPRGSTGYGQEFAAATRHDWGGKDYEDVMAVAGYAETLPWVDRDRMGVTGGSYGGYMTNWIIGHTRKFRAAVSQRSTCNRMSQFGSSDAAYTNGEFEFPGDPWDNPMAYLERSPIMYVRNVQTPLLLMHSEEDLRCPISQAEEFFVALKKLKKTVVMVRFPGENHELSRSGKPRHRVERLEYIAAWFDKYLAPKPDDYGIPLRNPEKRLLEF